MQIQVSVAVTSYTVSVYDWQHFRKLCDFSCKVCHLGFSFIRDSLFWCLASPGLSSLLRSEARHVCAHVYERCDSEKSASPSRLHSYSLSPLCKQCAVERLSIRREINAASPTEHALMSQSDFCPGTVTLFTGSLPGDKTAWQYLSRTLLLFPLRSYLRINTSCTTNVQINHFSMV